MEPNRGRPAKARTSSPHPIQVAVIERFQTTGKTVPELAKEFAVPEGIIQTWLSLAAEAVATSAGGDVPHGAHAAMPPLPWDEPDFEPEVPGSEAGVRAAEPSKASVPPKKAVTPPIVPPATTVKPKETVVWDKPTAPAPAVQPRNPDSPRQPAEVGEQLPPEGQALPVRPGMIPGAGQSTPFARPKAALQAKRAATHSGGVLFAKDPAAAKATVEPDAEDKSQSRSLWNPPSSPPRADAGGRVSEGVPPRHLLDEAVHSYANGTPLASLARWFNVPEAQLREWIGATEGSAPDPDPPAGITAAPPEPVRALPPARSAPLALPPAWPAAPALALGPGQQSRVVIELLPASGGVRCEVPDARPVSRAIELYRPEPLALLAAPLAPIEAEPATDSASQLIQPEEATSVAPEAAMTEPSKGGDRSVAPCSPVLDQPESARSARTRQREAVATSRPSSARFAPPVYSNRTGDATPPSHPRPNHSSLMGFRDSLQVLRRRLLIVVAVAVLGVAGGWFSAPGKSAAHVSYRATHTLIYQPHGSQTYNIEQVALLATSGDVPSRVAARLKLDRATVRSSVSAVASTDVSTIAVTARSADPAMAVSLADVTADELNAEITEPGQAAYDTQIKQLTGAVAAAQAHLNAVPAKDAAGQAAARSDLNTAEQALQQYKSSTPPPDNQLVTLEKATASAVKPAGVKAPNSKTGRALLLGVFGLLAGLAGAFGLERMDSRIRSKSRAEDAFGAPVIAEVPPIAKSLQGQLLTRTEATSSFIESYRGLRTYVALWAPAADEDDGHRVILVTSPGPGEGKTTTVAHLAAMLAELGRSVVVISADLRRPRIHQYFDQPEGPGLVEALAGDDVPDFEKLDRPTSVRNVRLVPSGQAVDNPAPLLEHAAELVRATRPLADFVLIDCPPLLVANDAVEMARHADGVLMVARSGKTPVEAAERSAELLERLDIPVVGTVLVGSEAVSNASRYYTARYYAEPERTGLRRRHSSDGDGERSAPEEPAARR